MLVIFLIPRMNHTEIPQINNLRWLWIPDRPGMEVYEGGKTNHLTLILS